MWSLAIFVALKVRVFVLGHAFYFYQKKKQKIICFLFDRNCDSIAIAIAITIYFHTNLGLNRLFVLLQFFITANRLVSCWHACKKSFLLCFIHILIHEWIELYTTSNDVLFKWCQISFASFVIYKGLVFCSMSLSCLLIDVCMMFILCPFPMVNVYNSA